MIQYLLEGLGIAFVTQYLIGKKSNPKEIILISLTITVALFILDQFAPDVGKYARQGAGFNIGKAQVGGNDGSEFIYDGRGASALDLGDGLSGYDDFESDSASLPQGFGTDQPPCDDDHKSPSELLSETIESMDDKVALDYYSHDRIPSENLSAQPEVMGQVNVIERFMDDSVALNYYSNDRQPTQLEGTSEGLDIHQKSIERIQGCEMSQRGGAAGGAAIAAFDSSANADVYSNYKPGPGQTTGQRGLVYGSLTVAPGQEHLARIKQTIYSNDLVNIYINQSATGEATKLVLLGNSKFVRSAPDGKVGLDDKFFKLRIQSVNNNMTKRMIPLKYGEPVKILFNDDTAKVVELNHNGDLNTLAAGKNNIFELVNQQDPASLGVTSFADKILIRRSVEGQKLRYLRVNEARARVETTSDMSTATVFSIQPQRGCGPLWRFDSDTRTTNTFNPSQVRDIVNARTQQVTDQLNQCQSNLRTLKGTASEDDLNGTGPGTNGEFSNEIGIAGAEEETPGAPIPGAEEEDEF